MDTQLSVLIVEDNQDLLDLLCLTFSAQGYLIRAADSRDDALKIIQDFGAPDIIITDWNMPGMSIENFIQHVRRAAPEAIFIMTSASVTAAKLARQLGIEFVQKPFDPEMLQNFVRSHLDVRSRRT